MTRPRIVDSHVHLWDPNRVEIPWLRNVPAINKVADLDDYAEATTGLDVDGLVYLQVEVAPPYALLEARDLVNLARQNGRVLGVVPWAPLEYGERVRYFLQELVALGPEIKGFAGSFRTRRTRSTRSNRTSSWATSCLAIMG